MDIKPFLLLIAPLIFANQIAFIKPYPNPKIINSPRASKYYASRNQIHAVALNRIKNEFNITDADWRLYADYVTDIVKKDSLFATYSLDRSSISANDHWLVQEAKEILIQCGIDPKNIEITLDNNPKKGIATLQEVIKEKDVINHVLIINPDWLGKLLPEERESVFRHEIMHLAFYDSLEEWIIVWLLKKNGYTQEAIKNNPAIINYHHQLEIRADILSVVDKPLLAKIRQNYFEKKAKFTKSYPADFWDTHPSDETRAQNFAQLLAVIKFDYLKKLISRSLHNPSILLRQGFGGQVRTTQPVRQSSQGATAGDVYTCPFDTHACSEVIGSFL